LFLYDGPKASIENVCPRCIVHLSFGHTLIFSGEARESGEKSNDRRRLLNLYLSIIPTLGLGGCLSLSLARSVNPSIHRSVVVLYAQKLSTVKSRKRRRRGKHTGRKRKENRENKLEYFSKQVACQRNYFICLQSACVNIYKWVNRCTEKNISFQNL